MKKTRVLQPKESYLIEGRQEKTKESKSLPEWK
jgi:hypothetical protein